MADNADAFPGSGDSKPKSGDPVLQSYNAEGKRVSPDEGVRQFLSDDPNRPDAPRDERDESGAKALGAPAEQPRLHFYDAEGSAVSAPVSGGRQYSDDDPNRPEPKAKAAAPGDKAIKAPAEDKAVKNSANK